MSPGVLKANKSLRMLVWGQLGFPTHAGYVSSQRMSESLSHETKRLC